MTAVHLLQAFPEVAEQYRRRFRHVLVDEYQDTNHAQYVLVRELVGTRQRRTVEGDLVKPASSTPELAPAELCVVGDADQSIYAFRGATIRNILQFETDYPDARVILLEQNYRSTQTILSAANAVISRNPDRKPKRLWTDSGDGPRSSATSPTTSTWRPSSSRRRSTGSATKPGQVWRRGGVLPHQRAVPGPGRGVRPGRAALPGRRRRPVLRAAGDPGRARLPAHRGEPGRLSVARRILNVPRRAIGDRSESLVEALASGRGSRSGRRRAGQQMRRGSQHGRCGRSSRSWR